MTTTTPVTDRFKAVTWNVYSGTHVNELRPILREQRALGVSLFLMQEAADDDAGDISNMLKQEGMNTFAWRQYRVAWDPGPWISVYMDKVQLSTQHFYAKDGKTKVWSMGARVILCDRHGRSLEVVSYHTPAHVQGPEMVHEVPRRYSALVQTMTTLGNLAEDSEARAVLFGGDDNWDEDTGFQTADTVPFLLGKAIGLRQVQANLPTHGRRREIDDFRIRRRGGIRPVGESWVSPGGGDHKLHGREFKWREMLERTA